MTHKFKQLHLTFAGQLETVPTAADLPYDGVIEGAIRYIEDTDSVTTFDGTSWIGLNVDTLTVNNLTVNNLAYINANVVEIGDNIIILNNDVTGTPTEDAGLCVERGDEPDACIIWDETNDTWTAGVEGDMVPIPGSSPAFVWSRSGAVVADTWLQNNSIPSNIAGIPVPYASAVIDRVFVDSGTQSTYSIGIYEHDHITYTLLATVTITADYGVEVNTNTPVTQGKRIAIKLLTGTANNVTVGLQLAA